MNGRRVVAVSVVIGVVAVTAGVGAVVTGVGPVSGLLDGEERQPPALVGFQSSGSQCTDDFIANSSTSVGGGGPNTVITHAQNVSLPDPSYAVGGPTFERRNESTYVLSVPVEATEKPPRDCAGFARYEATMRIPAGNDRWRILVEHENETVTTLFGDSDSTGISGSASGGSHVSA